MITLTKLHASENPDAPTSTDRSKQAEEIPDTESPWEGYTVKGRALGEPEVGRCFFVQRHERNGEEVAGYFRTSPIVRIEELTHSEKILTTRNSVYRLEIS